MVVLDIATVLLATVAITLSLWQFLTRHRPFVGLSKANISSPRLSDKSLTVTLKNWGEVPANSIQLTVAFYRDLDNPKRMEEQPRNMGILLPTQELRASWAVPPDSIRDFKEDKQWIFVEVSVRYSEPGLFSDMRTYSLTQALWAAIDDWVIDPTPSGVWPVEEHLEMPEQQDDPEAK